MSFSGFRRFPELRLTKAEKLKKYADTIARLNEENEKAVESARLYSSIEADQFAKKLKPDVDAFSPLPSQYIGYIPQYSDVTSVRDETKYRDRTQALKRRADLREPGITIQTTRKVQAFTRKKQLRQPTNSLLTRQHNELLASSRADLLAQGGALLEELSKPQRGADRRKVILPPQEPDKRHSAPSKPALVSFGVERLLKSSNNRPQMCFVENTTPVALTFQQEQEGLMRDFERQKAVTDLLKRFNL